MVAARRGLRGIKKNGAANLKRSKIVAGIAILAVGILPVVTTIQAIEPLELDTNSTAMREPAPPGVGATLSLSPFRLNQNLALGAVTESPAEAAEEDNLAKQLANPIASLISVPFQANEDFGYGPSHNGYKFTLNIQPVIPISISKHWNLILRTIVPIVSQHDLFYVENLPRNSPLQPQNRSQDGLSDTLQSFFFSPKKPGPFGLIWGIGPALLYPTGTHPLLGTGTFSIGPTVVALKQMGGVTAGILMNQLWSVVIEEHRSSLSQMFLQPFFSYTTKTHTTFTLSTESTANWDNTPGDAKWTVPVIGTVAQILKIGKQPISIGVAGKYYADTPRYGPDWGVRFIVTLLYPTSKRPETIEKTSFAKQ